ncbi:DNA-directed RNA polymerase subunit alpha C-terminal domain-containing protein [Nonomuraea sp. NPDC003707]
MNTTLPKEAQDTVAATKAAHDTLMDARDQYAKAVQSRNIGALVLIMTHDRPAATIAKVAGITVFSLLEETVPEAPVPDTLPALALEDAEAKVTEAVKILADFTTAEEAAREKRVRGVLKLSHTEVNGKRLTNAAIARLTGMSAQLVGKDLKNAEKLGYRVDDPEPAGPAGVPVAVMAERLGVTVKRIMDRVGTARRNGIPVEGTTLATNGRVLLYDRDVFPAWWYRNRFHWVTLAEFADSRDVPFGELYRRVRTARKNGVEWETTSEYGGVTLNDPEALAAWWEPVAKREEWLARGYDDQGRRTVSELARLLGMQEDQVEWKIRAARAQDDMPPHVVDERGVRWFEPLPVVAKVRDLDASVLDQSPAALGLTARTVDALQEAGIDTVTELLRRQPEHLVKLPGLGKPSVTSIVRKVDEAGWLFV